MEMEIKPYTRAHARAAAEIHTEGQSGTLLTRLGLDFLTRLYELFAESPHAFGFVVLDGTTVAGIGVTATDTTQLFRTIRQRHWHQLVWPVLAQLVREPALIGEIIQSLRYPNTLKPLPGEAEVLFLGLRRAYMRHGFGPRLVHLMLDEAHRRGCVRASTTIEKRNRAIRWTIGALAGIRIDQEIVLNGKTMLIYRAELPLGVDREPPKVA
jgi:GNAT superfamily N-acetyltransferase